MLSQEAVDDINNRTEEFYKKLDAGKADLVSNDEAKRLMKPTSIRLKPSLKMKIEAIAEREDRSFNNMVSRLLESAIAQ